MAANFIKYRCSVCRRKTTKPNDTVHATITKCDITYQCTGTLMKTGEASALAVSADFVTGIQNWVARGTITPTQTVEASQQYSIDSALGWLALAIPSSYAASSASVLFEVAQTAGITPVSYMYNRGSNISLIAGRDDSSAGISLVFSSSDIVVVYVNGVEISSTLYSIAVPNRISFTPALTAETNQIQIFVYSSPATTALTLDFIQVDSATVNSSAWANVESIKINNIEYSIYLAQTSSLTQNTFIYASEVNSGNIPLSSAFILRADPPFSNYDRDLFNYLSLENVNSLSGLVNYTKNSAGAYQCFVDQGLLSSSVLPISITSKATADISTTEVNSTDTLIQSQYST